MGFQVLTDMKQADELWEAGLIYCSVEEECDDWFLDDSNLHIYQGALGDWRPSQDCSANRYAVYVED